MSQTSLRVVFAGTPEFAAMHLRALIESEHQLICAYTQPDRPSGRGKKLQASPVKLLAEDAGIAVMQPRTLRDEGAQAELAALGADVMIVVAYGLILPQPVLDTPRLGCLNVHASLLPRWRGAAPIQRAIEAGDTATGITIMQMDAGLDTGAMLATASCPIHPHSTASSLHDELAQLGPPLLLETLAALPARQDSARAQNNADATYAHKLDKAEAALDWQLDATQLERRIRAFNPFPICHSTLAGERIRLWQARLLPEEGGPDAVPGTILRADDSGIVVRCGSGCLAIEALQLPGGKVLATQQVLAGRAGQFAPGTRFALPDVSPA